MSETRLQAAEGALTAAWGVYRAAMVVRGTVKNVFDLAAADDTMDTAYEAFDAARTEWEFASMKEMEVEP